MPQYHLPLDGQTQGPYTEHEVQQLHAERNLPPDIQLTDEHGNRVRYSALFPTADIITTTAATAPQHPPVPAGDFNPYQAPRSSVMPERAIDISGDYPGISRLAFFGCIFLIGFSSNILTAFTGSFIVGAIVMVLALFPAHSRLKNIGRNPNWCFLVLLPIVSLFVTVPCLVLPAGYQHHRRLDTSAKVIAVLCVAFLIYLVSVIFR